MQMKDRINVQDLDMLSKYGQADLPQSVFVAGKNLLNRSQRIIFPVEYYDTCRFREIANDA
jgi:hypothetical protein